MIDAVKIVGGVPLTAFFHQVGGALKHPPIHFLELAAWEGVAGRIKVAEIAKGETERVANFSIRFADLYHDALAHFYVGLILHPCNPQTEQLRAPALATLARHQRIPQ